MSGGPSGFWCPVCQTYQNTRTKQQVKQAREHVRACREQQGEARKMSMDEMVLVTFEVLESEHESVISALPQEAKVVRIRYPDNVTVTDPGFRGDW